MRRSFDFRRLARLVLAPLALLLLGALDCGSEEPTESRPAPDSVVRFWEIVELTRNGGESSASSGAQRGGIVDESHAFGALLLFPPEVDVTASAEIFSSADGFTYWVATEAPHTASTATVGSAARLDQVQRFRKDEANATLTMVVSRTFLDAIDSNPGLPSQRECPSQVGGDLATCARVMSAWARLQVSAVRVADDASFFRTSGTAELFGWSTAFQHDVHAEGGRRLWRLDDFAFDPDVTGTGGTRGQLRLLDDVVIAVPLDALEVGEEFTVVVTAEAGAFNLRQRESYLASFLRDPLDARGLTMGHTGLTPLETPTTRPIHPPAAPAPACPGAAEPGAGTLELAAPLLEHPELPGAGALVVVKRSGGSRGAVSARLVAESGSATAGADFVAADTHVSFDDGELGERAVRIPILPDDVVESPETVTLRLLEPRGCASLGPTAGATLTILDDDAEIGGAVFTVGGEVTGLRGSGLVLQEVKSGFDLPVSADGPFTFSYQHPDGSDYEVRVLTQPRDPFQVCTVAGGTGKIAGADVTDVLVSCTTVTGNGALDPGFGEGGKVTGAFDDIVAIALSPDGKIVAAGERTLRRFLPDGSADLGFGAGGAVTVGWGGTVEQINAVALQPDGKIVVAGQTRGAATSDDFAVARFTADGAPDGSFGAGGKAVLDFHGLADRAKAVMIAADGAIIVAGHAMAPAAQGTGNDFAATRWSAGGVLDDTFGKVTVNIAGNTDLAAAAALAPDGKIVIAGRVAQGGGDDPDIGLVRLEAGGARDGGFGVDGVVRHAAVPGWDEATDVAVAPDGKIVVAVKAVVGTTFALAAARFTAEGDPDGGFGSAGFVSTTFSDQNDFAAGVALDAAGRVVVVGQASNLSAPDFAIARYTGGGVLDASFGSGGTLSVDFFAAADVAECVAIQPDGKLVVGGVARNGATVGGALIRVLP